jgi:predicted deacetylase
MLYESGSNFQYANFLKSILKFICSQTILVTRLRRWIENLKKQKWTYMNVLKNEIKIRVHLKLQPNVSQMTTNQCYN